jgi:hypothetical protein
MVIDGNWELSFISGGPIIPKARQLSQLSPWTDFEGEEFKSFSGTAKYSCSIDRLDENQTSWLLNLGKVAESATVYINGKKIATLFSPPFQTIITADQLKESENKLEINVSNLMANRIIHMECNSKEYRNFYNVNFPARKAENRGEDGLFTSASWESFSSGLIGPVTITPVNLIDF